MTSLWWKAAFVRCIRTMAQSAGGVIGGAMAFAEVDWMMVLSATVIAGLLSLLTSIGGLPEVKEE